MHCCLFFFKILKAVRYLLGCFRCSANKNRVNVMQSVSIPDPVLAMFVSFYVSQALEQQSQHSSNQIDLCLTPQHEIT